MPPKALTLAWVACLVAGGLAAKRLYLVMKPVQAALTAIPAYTQSGEMLPPKDYREWIFLTSGIDMSYTAPAPANPDQAPQQSQFDNVFVDPGAYRRFLETGTWPDKTMMVLEARAAGSKASINRHGHFQSGGVVDMEIHVKDEARFPGKWAFFSFDSPSANGTLIPQRASCYSCHAAHAAVDTTFVQFYPTLLPVGTKMGTLSAAYLKEESAQTESK